MRRNALLAILMCVAGPALAADGVNVTDAWVPAADKGADTPMYLTAINPAAEDAIIRVRCDAANFTEFRTLDRGEGVPSFRVVKSIVLPAGTTELTSEGSNIRLLQLTRPLAAGERFECAVRLRGGGQKTVSVAVSPAEAGHE